MFFIYSPLSSSFSFSCPPHLTFKTTEAVCRYSIQCNRIVREQKATWGNVKQEQCWPRSWRRRTAHLTWSFPTVTARRETWSASRYAEPRDKSKAAALENAEFPGTGTKRYCSYESSVWGRGVMQTQLLTAKPAPRCLQHPYHPLSRWPKYLSLHLLFFSSQFSSW